MSTFRILKKSFVIAFRSTRRVTAFIIIYAILTFTTAYSLEKGDPQMQLIALLGGFMVASVYGILLSQFRKKDVAILKCISWGNSHILLLLVGEIFIVSLMSFILTLEIIIHIQGISFYFPSLLALAQDLVFRGDTLLMTFFLVVFFQVPGVILANFRATRISPMSALRNE